MTRKKKTAPAAKPTREVPGLSGRVPVELPKGAGKTAAMVPPGFPDGKPLRLWTDTECIAYCCFVVESLAHLQGRERELLPVATRVRAWLQHQSPDRRHVEGFTQAQIDELAHALFKARPQDYLHNHHAREAWYQAVHEIGNKALRDQPAGSLVAHKFFNDAGVPD